MAKSKKEPLHEETEEMMSEGEVIEPTETELLTEQLNEAKDQLLRTAAEYDNFKKRTGKEKTMITGDITCAFVGKFLPVMDNLTRAVAATEDPSAKEGIELIYNQFMDILSSLGVEEAPGEGEPFDPTFHNAVMHVEDNNFGKNTIAEVFEKGYVIGDRVVRHSMVKVAN